MLELTHQRIRSGELASKLADARAGALASFEGRVRNNHLGRLVHALEYEAAPELAKREFACIVASAKEQLPILDVLCVHRLGRLEIGEAAIWLGVLAPHRAEAFKGCELLMSELKKRLPIWKKEFFVDGDATWVDDPCSCVHSN
jgi:molybdopterin synthase catalytic subunit